MNTDIVKKQQGDQGTNARDLELARRCGEDDETARRVLFDEHFPRMFRLARSLVSDATDAEDIVQEAWISAYRSIGGYRGDAPLAGWLNRIVARTAWRCLRKRGRVRRDKEALLAEGAGDAVQADHGASSLSREALRALDDILDQLKHNRRVVFVLHEIEGYSLREAAEMLGISVTAAKKRVWRARSDVHKLARANPVLADYLARQEVGHD